MLVARIELDDYVKRHEPDQKQFQKLFDAVQDATAEYARLLKEQMEKYRPIIKGSVLGSKPYLS